MSAIELLPSDALVGLRIGLSVSNSPDLERLGLQELHLELALAEIARVVLVSGGGLAYGGYLRPSGYTAFFMKELTKYGRRDNPLLLCLAWQEHREVRLSYLETVRKQLGLQGEIVCLDVEGRPVPPEQGRADDPVDVSEPDIRSRSLTAMRRYMAAHTHARVLIGGRRHGFQGRIPGLMEEALLSIEANQPIYLAAGFGGVTADIARAVGVDGGSWLPRREDALPDDERLIEGANELAEAARRNGASPANGLTDDESRRLAATHRPSEIAALLSLGLARHMRDASQ